MLARGLGFHGLNLIPLDPGCNGPPCGKSSPYPDTRPRRHVSKGGSWTIPTCSPLHRLPDPDHTFLPRPPRGEGFEAPFKPGASRGNGKLRMEPFEASVEEVFPDKQGGSVLCPVVFVAAVSIPLTVGRRDSAPALTGTPYWYR